MRPLPDPRDRIAPEADLKELRRAQAELLPEYWEVEIEAGLRLPPRRVVWREEDEEMEA